MNKISYRVFGTWNLAESKAVYQVYKMLNDTKIIQKNIDNKSWSCDKMEDAEFYASYLNEKGR